MSSKLRAFTISIEQPQIEGLGDQQSGNLTWRTLISADRTPSAQIVLGVAEFPPYGRLNPHRHAPAEFYFGLAGEGTINADGETLRVATGVAVFVPPNVRHEVTAGAAGLSILYGFAKDAFEDIEYIFSSAGTGASGSRKRYRVRAAQ